MGNLPLAPTKCSSLLRPRALSPPARPKAPKSEEPVNRPYTYGFGRGLADLLLLMLGNKLSRDQKGICRKREDI